MLELIELLFRIWKHYRPEPIGPESSAFCGRDILCPSGAVTQASFPLN
jgi:hypothetical protein